MQDRMPAPTPLANNARGLRTSPCVVSPVLLTSPTGVPFPLGAIGAMASAIIHRGPDEDGFLERPGLALASRRLSIVGLADGRQPIANEDGSVWVVYNGELFDYPELRSELESKGHRFRTHCDTEVIPHLWEEYEERMFERLRGQFAIALWDERRRRLLLARDRFGVCPLYWTRQNGPGGEWLLFASEIKALLASGMVTPRADVRGINHLFTFFALPGPVTCFEGVQSLMPGHYLRIQLGGSSERSNDGTYLLGGGFSRPGPGRPLRRPAKAGGRIRGFAPQRHSATTACRRAGGFVPERRRRFEHGGRGSRARCLAGR